MKSLDFYHQSAIKNSFSDYYKMVKLAKKKFLSKMKRLKLRFTKK